MKRWLVNKIIKILSHLLLKIDSSELCKFPDQGPLIVAANHINFLDAPVLLSHLSPRPITGLVKKETWDNPLMGFLFDVWDGIPIDRTVADFTAFKLARKALDDHKILAVAPEGTRSEDGKLVRAKPGIGILVSQCDVPLLPIAYWGHEDFKKNIKHLKRSRMHIRVGQPFQVQLNGNPKNKETLQAMADAIMMEVAKLMPERYHGVYARGAFAVEKYVKYLD